MLYEYLFPSLIILGVGFYVGKFITRYYFTLEEWEADRKEVVRLLRKLNGEPEFP